MSEFNTTSFNRQEIELADLARALSHPGRIAILKALAARDGLSSGEITALLPLAQSTVSQHLLKLASSGLVVAGSRNNLPVYSLNREMALKFGADFNMLFLKH